MQPRQPRKNKSEPSLRARALRLLARREHSRVELERKLTPHAQDPDELAGLLDDLVRRGWLSERRLIEQVVYARSGKLGARRIRQELLEKGVDGELIAEALPQLKAGELETARAVWRKKFGGSPRNAAERARQVRFMQGRGFALDTILKIIKSAGAGEESV